jgi:hypothetical protein
MVPWGDRERATWRQQQTIKRSYQDEVVSKIRALEDTLVIKSYGTLSYTPARYPLYYLTTKSFDAGHPTVLITGGVHGYETSGVHGALAFMQNQVPRFQETFNIVCFPCISPWAYETINRWNPLAVDPNRSFRPESPAEECRFFLSAIEDLGVNILAHFDLHETTDTDNTVFRPVLEQRDGRPQEFSEIPDGFYLVGDTSRPERDFQKAIIDSVRKVTHIAPPDSNGNIIGVPLDQEGVIYYDMRKLSLCGGFSEAPFTTTTEVYPDSPRATPQICIDAQVAAILGGLEFLRAHKQTLSTP